LRFNHKGNKKKNRLEITLEEKSTRLTKCETTGSFVFLLASLTFIATILYLPHHIIFLMNRAWFYAHGDSVDVLELTKDAVHTLAQGALNAGTSTASSVGEAATEMIRDL